MKISVIGTGYIGLIQAVGLAKIGYKVNAIDVFEDKINMLKSGIPTIYEDGLEELLQETLENINFSTNMNDVVGSDIIFLCVGTPQDSFGKTDLSFIENACKQLKDILNGNEVLIIKSTVPVGTNKKMFNLLDGKIQIVSNPEFLREGIAIKDFFNPDRIVVGYDKNITNTETINKINEVYKYFTDKGAKIFVSNWETAELIKYASNSFLATKITFINEIARLADITGANIKDIALGMGSDDRIGEKFLNAGIGYGGSCFPKDVKSLIWQFKDNGLNGDIINSVDETNKTQVMFFIDKILKYYNNNLNGKTIGILGVAFKPDTDDLRESRGLEIIKILLNQGVKLKIFDYNKKALENFKKYYEALEMTCNTGFCPIETCENFNEICDNSDSLIITLEDKKILQEDKTIFTKLKDKTIFDGKNILNRDEIKKLGINYIGIGY